MDCPQYPCKMFSTWSLFSYIPEIDSNLIARNIHVIYPVWLAIVWLYMYCKYRLKPFTSDEMSQSLV